MCFITLYAVPMVNKLVNQSYRARLFCVSRYQERLHLLTLIGKFPEHEPNRITGKLNQSSILEFRAVFWKTYRKESIWSKMIFYEFRGVTQTVWLMTPKLNF